MNKKMDNTFYISLRSIVSVDMLVLGRILKQPLRLTPKVE